VIRFCPIVCRLSQNKEKQEVMGSRLNTILKDEGFSGNVKTGEQAGLLIAPAPKHEILRLPNLFLRE
jgi:hypothetical protein